jgi:polysaccharide biosynthesis/export protein
MRFPGRRAFASFALLALSAPVVAAQEGPTAADSAPSPEFGRKVLIGPEDSLTIKARDAEEISDTWRVANSGALDLPMVGRIHVAGMAPSDLEVELVNRLKRYVRQPQVTVWISEFRSQPVTIAGAVAQPGAHQLRGARTLFETMVLAGGARDAGRTVTVTRDAALGSMPVPTARTESDGRYNVVEFELSEVMNGRSAAANFEIRPYDLISVPPAEQRKLVHILGEVTRPGAVELVTQETVSLLRVLAMAGGMTRQAAPGSTLITHVSEDGTKAETAVVNLKTIMRGKAQDLELSAGDVVVVPSSQLKAYLQVASVSALNAGVLILGRL